MTISDKEIIQSNRVNKLQESIRRLPNFCERFFVGIENNTSILTRLGYAQDLQIFFDFLSKNEKFKSKSASELNISDIEAIDAFDIEKYLSYLTSYRYNGKQFFNKDKAKARKLSSVKSLFRYLYNRDIINQNVTSKIATPKLYSKNIIRLNDAEVKTLVNTMEMDTVFKNIRQDKYNIHTKSRDIAIITLFLSTGIRVSELAMIDVDDIDIKGKSFIVTRKGGNRSILYFSNETQEALNIYMDDRQKRTDFAPNFTTSALFVSLQNKRLGVRAIENVVKKYSCLVTNIKNISPHKLRSTFGTALYNQTNDIYVVAEVLGHKDINTTKKHYADTNEKIKKSALNAVVLKKNHE